MNDLISNAVSYLFGAVLATGVQLMILLLPGLLLAFVMNAIALLVRRLAYQFLGRGLYLGLFGWLGTSIHELGHAFFNIIFGHHIVEMRLFDPDTRATMLGYVKYRYNPQNLYHQVGRFFAGIGPILFGSAVIYIAFLLLLAPSGQSVPATQADTAIATGGLERIEAVITSTWLLAWEIFRSLFLPANLVSWRFYLFVYIALAVGSSITLSDADIKGASSGFLVLLLTTFLFNLCTLWLGNFANELALSLSQVYGFFYAIMLFVIALNLLLAAMLSLVSSTLKLASPI